MELANALKMRPQTKHINLVYHNFHAFVRDKTVIVHAIGTLDQTGDILTKPLDQNLFQENTRKSGCDGNKYYKYLMEGSVT